MAKKQIETYYSQFEHCRQNEIPFCQESCPLHLDVLDFVDKMEKNKYNAAYKTLKKAMGFPDIAAALCPQHCAPSCPRGAVDHAVKLSLLEKTCVARATKKDPFEYNLPVKNGKAAVIGAGLSALGCALRLCSKKYAVTIFEKTGRIGGKLWDLLPPAVFLEDIERQFKFEQYELHLHTEIHDLEELRQMGFDAVYAATGEGGDDFGVFANSGPQGLDQAAQGAAVKYADSADRDRKDNQSSYCYSYQGMAVFAGGGLLGRAPVHALADGFAMAWAIEVFLQTGKLEYPQQRQGSKVTIDRDKLYAAEPALPDESGIFTEEGAAREAGRCIRCQCDACRTYCDLAAFTQKWPLKMRDEILTTVMASESMIHKTPAIRLINMCTQCQLCAQSCPGGIELGKMLSEARRLLHQIKKMPGAFHQYWLRDMAHANGASAAVCRNAPGRATSAYAFFPGCHLGAAGPHYVTSAYRWLLSKEAGTGLLLRCCGVPALWAGDEQLHRSELEALQREWKQLAEPVLITACASCARHLAEYLPQIKTISLYEILAQQGFDAPAMAADRPGLPAQAGQPESAALKPAAVFSIFDPCAARGADAMRQAVRTLAGQAGLALEELPGREKQGCCGFGGHAAAANPGFTQYIAQKRAALGQNPYLVYCINCKEAFLRQGKPAVHLLDVLFAEGSENAPLPGLSARRHNRITLKQDILREFWGEQMQEKPKQYEYDIIIGAAVQDKMDQLRFVEEDVRQVIDYSQRKNRRTFHPDTNTFTCYHEIGSLTCWLDYRMAGEAYEITDIYAHRMKIEMEAVWNGRKTDFDL